MQGNIEEKPPLNQPGRRHVKEMFSHTVIYGLGLALNKSVTIILLPLYTKYFSTEELGLYTLVLALSFFLGVVYTYGMETSFIKFFIDEKNITKRKEIYSTTLISVFISSVFLSLILFLLSGQISSAIGFYDLLKGEFLIKVLAVMLVADTVYRFPLLLFRADLNTKTYSFLNILTFIINLAFNFIFIVYIKTGVEGIFYSYFIAVLLTFLTGLILTRRYFSFRISVTRFKELVLFGNKFIYIGIALIIIDQSDKFFLKYFLGEGAVGVYWANYRLATVMSLVVAAYRFSWTPYFLNLAENPDNKKIISNIFTYFVFAGVTLFLFFSTIVKHLVQIPLDGNYILAPDFWTGLTIIPLILLAYLFSGLFHNLNAAPFFKNRTIFILVITTFGLAVNLFLNFFLVQMLGINGAALTLLLTYVVMFIWIYFYSQKIYKIEYEWSRIIKISFIASIIFILNYFIIISPGIGIIISILSTLLFLFLINAFGLIELKKVKILFKRTL
jgi:O-antigen/teichoic acid export membrane protein